MKKLFLFLLMLSACVARSQYIPVPNGSFESPSVPTNVPASPEMDAWLKTPQPVWWDTNNGPWEQLIGEFPNVPPGYPGSIENLDGEQAAFLFGDPQVGIFQQLSNTFAVGKSYTLTVGLTTSTYEPLSDGATLLLSLYYPDSTNQVTIAATTVTYDTNSFPNLTDLFDFSVNIQAVKASDAWAGQPIGISILSTVSFALAGGVWDADNVRLIEGPSILSPTVSAGQASFTISSYPGLAFNILGSADATTPLTSWTSLATVTNTTGQTNFTDSATGRSQRFYILQQLP
jgi:hypothetical protein